MVDALGPRGRIGIVVPSTNTSAHPESEMLRPRGVTNQVARITIKERPLGNPQAFMEHVEAMRAGIGSAIEQILTCQPTRLIMGVALEAFWGGVDTAARFHADLEAKAGMGVSMGSIATVRALKAFDARRIAVLTPHQPSGDEMVRKYFEEAGYDVVRLKGLKCASPTLIAHTAAQDVVTAFKELDGDDIDAIVQVGTNLACIELAAEAERWCGKPVLAINAVTYWDALRQSGIDDRIYGYGSLMERF